MSVIDDSKFSDKVLESLGTPYFENSPMYKEDVIVEFSEGDLNSPYYVKYRVLRTEERFYNKYYGDNRKCVCGHTYISHFDTQDDLHPCGCHKCGCKEFREIGSDMDMLEEGR